MYGEQVNVFVNFRPKKCPEVDLGHESGVLCKQEVKYADGPPHDMLRPHRGELSKEITLHFKVVPQNQSCSVPGYATNE